MAFTDWSLDNDIPNRTDRLHVMESLFLDHFSFDSEHFVFYHSWRRKRNHTVIKSLFHLHFNCYLFCFHLNVGFIDEQMLNGLFFFLLFLAISLITVACTEEHFVWLKRKKKSNEIHKYLHNDLFINLVLKTC